MKNKKDWRIYALLILLFLIYGALIWRLFLIQVIRHGLYTALAQDQYQILKKITPLRGDIFAQDKDGSVTPLATIREYPMVYLAPKEIIDKEKTAQSLSQILSIDKDVILAKANKNDSYESLKSKLDENAADEIKNLGIKGVYLAGEELRWYPQGELASQLIGFLGYKDDKRVGQYGLEGYYEKNLAGMAGLVKTEKDAKGKLILTTDYDIQSAQDGDKLYLTIDPNIQFLVEQKLKAILEKWDSPSGSVIVTEPKTGAIKAMASFPDFDPNNYSAVASVNDFLNPVTQKLFEPGSSFKPITMAAGLDLGKVSPSTTYVDTGFVEIGGQTIKNAAERSYGLSDMSRVLEKSINTGAVFVERQVGNDNFRKYVEAFGFNKPTGIDLSGEISGNISNLKTKREINFATASFGQGIAVTPIEMAMAIGAIANKGEMMKPHVVDKIVHSDGSEQSIGPEPQGQIISRQAAKKLTDMLVNTVLNGYDKIKISGYFIAGKTGTAQVPNEDKSGYSDQTIHSFVGYAPAYDPKFLIFIKMDNPTGINFASDSLSPTFANIAKYLFNYYQIPPDEPQP